MSTQTVKICDIDNCGQLATQTLPIMFFNVWTDNGTRFEMLKDVDLCGQHEFKYRTQVPVVHINGHNAHRTHEEDIK